VVDAIKAAEDSVFPEVVEWANETIKLMEREIEVPLLLPSSPPSNHV
jgi:hypothetical protein